MTRTAALIDLKPRITHEPHNWTGGLLWVLCACLALGWIDSMDNADYWQREAERAQAEVERRNALETIPNPAIVLDARTAEKFGLRLGEIAGGLDDERAKLWRRK